MAKRKPEGPLVMRKGRQHVSGREQNKPRLRLWKTPSLYRVEGLQTARDKVERKCCQRGAPESDLAECRSETETSF